MYEAPSPSSSSTGSSTMSDSESNDSGIDSVSSTGSGRFPADYMDIDEFLTASSVRENQCKDFDDSDRQDPTFVTSNASHAPPVVVDSGQKTTRVSGKKIIRKEGNKDMKNVVAVRSGDTSNNVKDTHSDSTGEQGRKREKDDYSYNPLPIGKKAKRNFVPDKEKDESYWTRRVKNNVAARRSRDMRRQKEIEISMKWKELEQENARLKEELQKLKDRANELERQLMEKQEH